MFGRAAGTEHGKGGRVKEAERRDTVSYLLILVLQFLNALAGSPELSQGALNFGQSVWRLLVVLHKDPLPGD